MIDLFFRVDEILKIAHKNIVSSVNINMVYAYWLIGREIVLDLQDGKKRATYGEQIIEELSKKLNEKYKKGFSASNLNRFRKFYIVYSERIKILSPMGAEFKNIDIKPVNLSPMGTDFYQKVKEQEKIKGFSSQLTWSHYRALMRVKDVKARLFYESEAIVCGWDKRSLERQIHSSYYQRVLRSQTPEVFLEKSRKDLTKQILNIDFLKNPYVLEFLNLPEVSFLKETQLETAIINHLQIFLLELGKGFAFVARQKKMQYNDKTLYIDLVFYNSILKCYLLIDLKMGELSHKDIGQMESYVRMFDDLFIAEDDKPSIGLILCTEKNETIAKYSVLNDRQQIFASKYMLYLPTEEELIAEIDKEIKMLKKNNLLNNGGENNDL